MAVRAPSRMTTSSVMALSRVPFRSGPAAPQPRAAATAASSSGTLTPGLITAGS
jgi:hypothetical protein